MELREMQLGGWKPDTTPCASETVVYKHPFEQVTTEDGTVFHRNEAVTRAERLRLGRCGPQFTIFSRLPGEA